jgi:thiol-disulfide isomerase/thioredoxin
MRSPFRAVLVAAVLVLALGGVALLRAAPARRDLGPEPAAGRVARLAAGMTVIPEARRRPLPAFAGTTLDGTRFDLASLRGHVAVVNFWGSWCGPCRSEQVALQQASRELAGRGVRFVGVNVRDNRADALAFLRQYRVSYPSLNDQPGELAAKLGSLGPVGPPYTLVVDAQGRVAAQVQGALNAGQGPVGVQVAQLRDLVDQVSGTAGR